MKGMMNGWVEWPSLLGAYTLTNFAHKKHKIIKSKDSLLYPSSFRSGNASRILFYKHTVCSVFCYLFFLGFELN